MVHGRVMPVTSASWNASLPITLVATCPLKTMIGIAVHLGGRQRRDGVGRRRAAGDDADAGLAGRAGIAVGTVARALLVAVQDELGRRLVELIEHRQDRAAGIAEHHIDLVLLDEHLVQDLGAALALVAGLGGRRTGKSLSISLERGHSVSREKAGANLTTRSRGFNMDRNLKR